MDVFKGIQKNGALTAVVAAVIIKKLFKKELLPVSTWKQGLVTFLTISFSHTATEMITSEIEKRNTIPKPK